jgi:phosphoglycolate phosphatase-like HAD superfamily hydrolase
VVEHPPELAIFDFDGTLHRLATDYAALRRSLEELAAELGVPFENEPSIYRLSLLLEHDPRLARTIAEAELAGLAGGADVHGAVDYFREVVGQGVTVLVVTHNSAEVIEEFLRSRGLPAPAAIFDRRALAAPKDESEAVVAFVRERRPASVLVVGDAPADRRLAERLGAEFLHAPTRWG